MDDAQINNLAINDLVRKLRENIIRNDPNDLESLRTVDECAKKTQVNFILLICSYLYLTYPFPLIGFEFYLITLFYENIKRK